jgi:putative membrane protein
MTFGWHYPDGGWIMAFGVISWIVPLILIAVVIWLVVRTLSQRPSSGSSGTPPANDAEEVLRRRFASGEIDADEYERRLEVLRRR